MKTKNSHIRINAHFYQLLEVPRDASPAVLKAAYHRALLKSHPDKRATHDPTNGVEISLIKQAYAVLSDSQLRDAHDATLDQKSSSTTPRPAQVISLEEFQDESSSVTPEDAEEGPWRYSCRCGGWYRITVPQMENGDHLIACNSCSEVVWVGYELADHET
ncbi:Diphthamide biosynthesis protein 4 [Psilocybe cubensis]|uniref:Diphthamide biosynthesis protein 4 n=2 Tax=Psilocybe cubensis TaxID=181762 RepID=A0A8H8CR84_PSICU|nr:Diphthamide biosynthesis protein 4 [Psilocybe cubensis]KAH9486451.1 Diphthamide biosynthesis protein 4 [Psilocybe cubensis]